MGDSISDGQLATTCEDKPCSLQADLALEAHGTAALAAWLSRRSSISNMNVKGASMMLDRFNFDKSSDLDRGYENSNGLNH
jgi:hypothetical protein